MLLGVPPFTSPFGCHQFEYCNSYSRVDSIQQEELGACCSCSESRVEHAVSLPEGFDVALVSDILAQEKAKKDLKTAEDVARVAAAFDGLRCTLADTCVAAHSRAITAAATAEEHSKLLLKLNTALAAASSVMDAQHEPTMQSARCAQLPPGTVGPQIIVALNFLKHLISIVGCWGCIYWISRYCSVLCEVSGRRPYSTHTSVLHVWHKLV